MVVYTNMCADLMHAGHVSLLERAAGIARGMGAALLVGVHSCDALESYKRRPILTMGERAAMVRACRHVDAVLEDAPMVVTEEFMARHDVQLVVHAHDEGDASYDKYYAVPIKQGRFRRLDYTDSISTTDIIRRCQNRT